MRLANITETPASEPLPTVGRATLSPPRNPDAWVSTHRATYERMAADYARRIDDYAAADEAERFTRLAAPSDWSGPRILDAGCGPGRDAALLRLAGAEVVGLDLARAMLHEARRLDDSAHFSQGDLRRLPFPASSFDAVWCFAALGHLPPAAIAHALSEFRRVLNSGWLYVVVRQGSGVRASSWQGCAPPLLHRPHARNPHHRPPHRRLHHPRTKHLARPQPNPLAPHHRPGCVTTNAPSRGRVFCRRSDKTLWSPDMKIDAEGEGNAA